MIEASSQWLAAADGPLVDLCLILEETGAVLAPGPLLGTAALFAPLVREVDSALFDDVVSGAQVGTVAVADIGGRFEPHHDPVKAHVLDVESAAALAVIGGGPTMSVVEVEALSADAISRLTTIDSTRDVFLVDTSGVESTSFEVDSEVVERALLTGAIGLSAELVGTIRWMLEATIAYAITREQFDRPIGSFQAVQHKLADAALDHERTMALTYGAAMALDAGVSESARLSHSAKATASEVAVGVARQAMQIHGGIGFTAEHDLHLYFRRALASAALFGDAAFHHDRLADLLAA